MDLVGGSWVGNFACSVCRRKRLTGESFSGTQLRKLRERTLGEDDLKCKACVTAAEAAQRERYARIRMALDIAISIPYSLLICSFYVLSLSAYEARKESAATSEDRTLLCSICKQEHPLTSFSNTQARKPDDARKCRECSAAAEAMEAAQVSAGRRAKMKDAQTVAAAAEGMSTGKASAAARLHAAASECAAEAELVTGLKPLVGAGKRRKGQGQGSAVLARARARARKVGLGRFCE